MNIEYNKTPEESKLILQSKQMDLDAGALGRWFGSSKNAALNIAGLLVVLLTVTGIAVLFVKTEMPAGEYWKMILPFLSIVVGYVFGKSK